MPRAKRFLTHIRDMIRDYQFNGNHIEFLLQIKAFIDSHYKRPENVYSVTKRIITQESDDKAFQELSRRVLRQTFQEKVKCEEKAQRAVEKRNEHVTTFAYEYVRKVIDFCKMSNYVPDMFIALQLASGVRQRDLFDHQVCQFSYLNELSVKQMGSSKTRAGAKQFESTKLLVGMSATLFLKLLQLFREQIRSPVKASCQGNANRWNARLCARTREFFPIDQDRSGTHTNRALYAAMIRYRFPDGQSSTRRVQNALGHSKMTSSLHYLYVDIGEKGFSQPVLINSGY
jgi:hypothetical protein